MNAKKCDRCGSYYEPTNEGNNALKIFNIFSLVGMKITRDICPDCMDDLQKWLKQEATILCKYEEEKHDI